MRGSGEDGRQQKRWMACRTRYVPTSLLPARVVVTLLAEPRERNANATKLRISAPSACAGSASNVPGGR